MRTIRTSFHMVTAEATNTAKATFSPRPDSTQRSPWHSPIPYLFGGLAAVLCLIAFALLMLACSYWKLYDQSNGEEDGDTEKGDSSIRSKGVQAPKETFLVIMAGEVRPTFLATPLSISISCTCEKQEKVVTLGDQTILETNREHGSEQLQVTQLEQEQ